VALTEHAELRAAERRLSLREIADLVWAEHERRRKNPGDADWMVHARGIAVAYNWPDRDDPTTALVVTLWRE
jgi:hypothetical protein